MNIHPLNKIKIAGTILGVLVIGLVLGSQNTEIVRANSGDNVHGYLFSDMPTLSDQNQPQGVTNVFGGSGLGYISLNNVAPDPVLPGSYGVRLDPATGDLSGQGWGEYAGWLDFDATGFPLAGGTAASSAKIMPSCWTDPQQTTCPVIGWARFTAATQSQSGGWDGWLSLNTTNNPALYGVTYNKTTNKFLGKAWGSDVVGWVDFSNASATITPLTNGVCTDPTADNYTNPLAPGQVSDPSVCTYPIDYCTNHPCTPLSPICKLHPELCAYVNHVCNVPATPNGTSASNYVPGPYTNGQIPDPAVCLYPGCITPGATNYNSQANISNNTCIFAPVGPGGGSGAPLNPIYIEN